MNIRLQLLQIMKDFKANMLLLPAVERLLDEVRLIKAFSSFLHISLQQLHAFFISDLQTLFAQDCPEGKVVVDPLESYAKYGLDEEVLSDGKDGDSLQHFQKQLVEVIFFVVL